MMGGVNTLSDFAVFYSLVLTGMPPLVANYISTFVALMVSFIGNRRFTFKRTEKNLKNQIFTFTVVTLAGLWVLQPLIIVAVEHSVEELVAPHAAALLGKSMATCITLVWNYYWYSHSVFREKHSNND